MLPRRARLPRHGFTLLRSLTRTQSEHFLLIYGNSTAAQGAAVVVSKKVAKRAVDRHRLKRRLRAIITPFTAPGAILVVHAKPGAATLPFEKLQAELETLLARSSVAPRP